MGLNVRANHKHGNIRGMPQDSMLNLRASQLFIPHHLRYMGNFIICIAHKYVPSNMSNERHHLHITHKTFHLFHHITHVFIAYNPLKYNKVVQRRHECSKAFIDMFKHMDGVSTSMWGKGRRRGGGHVKN